MMASELRVKIIGNVVIMPLRWSDKQVIFNTNHLIDVFDASDYWTNSRGYAMFTKSDGTIYLHKVISKNVEVDHKDRNTYNNLDSNLRPATRSQNMANRQKMSGKASSRYKGVSWRKDMQKWGAQIRFNKKLISLGFFKIEEDAAKAYNKKAIELFGEFSCLNLFE